MRKILLIILSIVTLYASVESEVENKRFKWNTGVLTDTFSGVQWQDNMDIKTIKKGRSEASDYCSDLNLNGNSNWYLPGNYGLYIANQIKNNFKNLLAAEYRSDTNGSWHYTYDFKKSKKLKRSYSSRDKQLNVLCMSGSLRNFDSRVSKERKKRIKKRYDEIYQKIKNKNTINGYEEFKNKHPYAPQVNDSVKNIHKLSYKQVKKIHTISEYKSFIHKFPKAYQVDYALESIDTISFNKALQQNTINDYKIFIKENPNSSQLKQAWKNIHILSYKNICKINSIKEYTNFIKFYPNASQIKNALKKLFILIQQENNISDYVWFIKNHPKSLQVKSALESLYILINKQNNIAGYEWYIQNYPKSKQTKDAIKNIHKLAFAKAKQLNTISSLNTFIISYPYAKEIKEAVDLSYNLETQKYKKNDKDDEKKARLLAVRIKKMTFRMKKQNQQIGYEIVIDRMSKLLTEAYEETDASLRYYESKEFTEFASKFDTTMRNISTILNKIENNTSNLGSYMQDMINISRQGYADAKSDRAITAHYEAQKTEWDKTMHLFDKGYR